MRRQSPKQAPIQIDRRGVAHTEPLADDRPAAFFFRYSEHSRRLVQGREGELDEEHLVVLAMRGRFESGVVLKPDDDNRGVWLIDPASPDIDVTVESRLYFMSLGGRIIDITNGEQVVPGHGKFELNSSAIERYEAGHPG